MPQEISINDATENVLPEYLNQEKGSSDEKILTENQTFEHGNGSKENAGEGSHKKNKNSAAKAVSHAQSVIGNTNPNIRTGLSDGFNNTGTNVAYTEREA